MRHFYLFIGLLICLMELAEGQNRIISGVVKDSETKEPIAYSGIMLMETEKFTSSDTSGNFKLIIPEKIKSPFIIISCFGFQTDTLEINSGKNYYEIFLQADLNELDSVEIIIKPKTSFVRDNPVSIISIPSKVIDNTVSSNIVDALVKNAPGLNAVKTGPNISKPFIRGLGYNRVLTLYDGIRQEGQQWGDEHGIEVDGYNLQNAEVIKGPASLMYGSDALAGVVSMKPYIPEEKDGKLRGKVLSEYQSNNGLIGNGLRLGYSGKKLSWAVRSSYRIAKNYTNKIDGRVYNTGFQEVNSSALIGYIFDKGFTRLNFTLYDNIQGIPDGSRDSLTRSFTKQIYDDILDVIKNRPLVSNNELNTYRLSPLIQHIQHYRLYSNNHFQLGNGNLDASIALQQSVRREYNHPTATDQAGMYVKLNTLNYGIKYNAPKFLNTEISGGINGMYQTNENKDGTDFPIPDYHLLDVGSYLFGKWKNERCMISGGIRFDTRLLNMEDFYVKKDATTGFNRHVNEQEPGAKLQFAKMVQTFNGISSSIGTAYWVNEKISLKGNIARGYRAPNISEIASNGLDPGAHIVYIGNRNFKPEFSFQQDLGIFGTFKNLDASVSLFNNYIQNYIYLGLLVDANRNPVVIVPGNKTFQYQQSSAHLYGLEATLDFHPTRLKGLTISNNYSMVYGINTNKEFRGSGVNGAYLPFIPPVKLLTSVNKEIKTKWKIIKHFDLKGEADINAAQNRYMALYSTETRTAAYALFNIGIGTEINYSAKTEIQLQFQINNLFNTSYQSNLSRLKYFEYYNQSSSGKYGIYGMGRNITMRMIALF